MIKEIISYCNEQSYNLKLGLAKMRNAFWIELVEGPGAYNRFADLVSRERSKEQSGLENK